MATHAHIIPSGGAGRRVPSAPGVAPPERRRTPTVAAMGQAREVRRGAPVPTPATPSSSADDPAATCPAAALGKQYAQILSVSRRLDRDTAGRPQTELDRENQRRVSGRMRQIEDAISFTQATSLAGALAQIGHASDWMDCFGPGDTDEDIVEKVERVQRLLYSIRYAIEAATGLSGEEFGADFNMERDADPRRVWLGEVEL
jgi:hypothetical protein